jgi:hypothetical protein
MPRLFILSPSVDQIDNSAWRNTKFKERCCIFARCEIEARGKIAMSTLNMAALALGKSAQSPWMMAAVNTFVPVNK